MVMAEAGSVQNGERAGAVRLEAAGARLHQRFSSLPPKRSGAAVIGEGESERFCLSVQQPCIGSWGRIEGCRSSRRFSGKAIGSFQTLVADCHRSGACSGQDGVGAADRTAAEQAHVGGWVNKIRWSLQLYKWQRKRAARD